MMQFFSEHISPYLTQLDVTIIFISVCLAIAASPIIQWLSYGHQELSRSLMRVHVMRVLNGLIIGAIVLKTIFTSTLDATWIGKIVNVLITTYFAVFCAQIVHFFLLKHFGKQRSAGEQLLIADSYSSRALSLFSGAFIAVIASIVVLKIVGLDSWLQAGGVFGILGIFLAITQASWAPDLIGGLIILNSRRCEEGDVIQFTDNGRVITAQVFKTKFFHTELLDLTNNHRLMMRNDKMRDIVLHNLSRFASAKGLRECLSFNIGYEHLEGDVTAMIIKAFEKFDAETELREEQFVPEIRVLETGDYAVKWGVFYYVKNVKEILAIRQALNSYILKESIASNISLSTPVLQDIKGKISKAE
jgi:small-conductance mechanosensitive channel